MKLIIGLGNPGKQYAFTRHNIGFIIVEHLADKYSVNVGLKGFDAIYGRGKIGSTAVLLVKPQTYMNRSGYSVSRLFEYFKITDYRDVIAIHDDLDLPFGTIRIKSSGGHGGHKGLLSTMEQLGSADFLRLRIGIGRPTVNISTEDYVLGRFPEEEMKYLPKIVSAAGEAITDILSSGVQAAMNKYNGMTINNFSEEV